MKHLLKLSVVLGLLFLASPAKAQISFGIQFGTLPPPPRAYRVEPMPGPDYAFASKWDLSHLLTMAVLMAEPLICRRRYVSTCDAIN